MTTRIQLLALTLLGTASMYGGEWSAPVQVLHDMQPCVTYRARLDGPLLVVEAAVQPGWHTFTMDNDVRSKEKLAGKPSLGVDQPTKITVGSGLDLSGPWYQTQPLDFSKPELRWFSWGYEKTAVFATKARAASSKPVEIGIRGQACTEKTCKNIDVTLTVPVGNSSAEKPATDISKLIAVR